MQLIDLFNKRSQIDVSIKNIDIGIYSFINSYSYFIARRNQNLFNKFDHLFADGFVLVFFYNLFFFRRKIKRTSFDMTSIADTVFKFACIKNKSVYLIGAKKKEIRKTVEVLRENYDNLQICGFRDGYFSSNNEEQKAIEQIVKTKPDIIIVGMGTLKQEQFLVKIKNTGWDGIGFTCGGFLHQTAERLHYYPEWINKYNLRWLYRLTKEPHSRMRVLKTYTVFPLVFCYDVLRFKLSK